MRDESTHFDVIIIGAGLSGVCAAWHLQDQLPHKTYTILEGRERMGGTWDLFRYPGVRSDSDMYTLGYSFRPWTNPKAIADGPSILAYIEDTARAFGIDRKVRYGHRVERASWVSRDARWTLTVQDTRSGATKQLTCSFLFACAGYYDYERGHAPTFAGRERFGGLVVHPQHWPEGLDCTGKRVVVIGSGATAMTLVPELAKRAAHVTMLQRSPTYVIALPGTDAVADWLRGRLPERVAYGLTRWKNVLFGMGFYAFSRRFPEQAKRFLVGQVRRAVGDAVDVGRHFTPRYNPWDQRLCLVPDGDLFEALRTGRASVLTDEVETFTETGLRLKSGAALEADIVVTATGLELKFLGGVALEVDGRVVEASTLLTYKGMMLGDVPNLAVAIGYTNASWTLKCDLTCAYVCRLLRHMERHGYAIACPRNDDPSLRPQALIDLTANYVLRAVDRFPRQGHRAPWRVYQNYVLDRMMLRFSPIDDGVMRFSSASA
jgi:cation diffusion facilitator CzcD-associated flavoprotein CzcO